MNDDAIDNAVFTGAVKFEEQGLQAAAGEAHYDPMNATLQLTGVENGVAPHVADEQVTIDANAISVGLQGRAMKATGAVKTILRASKPAARGATAADQTKLPSLLKQDQPANANGDALDYQGAAGLAVYSGSATLWQGETAIRADTITIDQAKGDLTASGNARSTIALDTGTSIAKAGEILYSDAAHTITYEPVKTVLGAVTAQSQLSGTQGDLRADRIQVILAAAGGSHLERLEAYTNAGLKLDTRTAVGERLTYFADDERYVMTGAGTKPVRVVDQCRETTGKTLTFFKSTDRILVDGNEERRTQTKNGAAPACSTTTRGR
jgi:lipopolysaccharide export system protein LptA